MPNLYPGLLLHNRYQLQKAIGKGGFSIVWLAEDLKDTAKVALKFSLPDQSGTFETALRMEQEYQATRAIHHPNLMIASDLFKYEDSTCLVFDYKENGTLHGKLKHSGPLPEAEIARLMLQTSSALHLLHANALIHFDVKPENILIGANGDFFLSDLDTASKVKNSMVRVSRIFADTPQYRSPEHLKGANELSDKVDIFALGITFFECCEGIIEKDYGIGMMLLTEKEKPSISVPKYSMRLDQIIKACWNYSPADRPTADALSVYAKHYLNAGFWPEVIEYKPEDKPITEGNISFSDSMRQTVGRPTIPNFISEPEPSEVKNPFPNIPQFPSGSKEIPQSNYTAPSEPVKDSPFTPPLHPMGGMKPPLPPTDSKPVNPPSWGNQMRQTLSTLSMKEKPYVKWGALAIILALVLAIGYCGMGKLGSDAKYNEWVEKAVKLREEGKLKAASDAIKEALKIKKNDVRATQVEDEILHDADARHSDQIHFARLAIENANASDLEIAKNQLIENKEDASILVQGDQTEHYLQLLDLQIGQVSPPAATDNVEPEPENTPKPEEKTNPRPNNQSPDPVLERIRAEQREEQRQEQLWIADKKSKDRNRISNWTNHPRFGNEANELLRNMDNKKPAPAPVEPAAPPTPGVPSFKFVGYAGAKNPGSNCKSYNTQRASISIKPDKSCRLENASVYASGCGKIRITLSGNGKNASENKELSDGKCDFEFDRIDAITLEKDKVYTLSIETAASDNCPGDPVPQLLNAADCGAASSIREGVQMDYQGKVVLFSLKYRY